MLQLAHIHQVVVDEQGKPRNHRPIEHLLGPRINYAGLLAAMAEQTPRRVPLLVEVRDVTDAVRSCEVLRNGSVTARLPTCSFVEAC
ncbi:hypothetical protein ACERK3_17445 [Phycisphaerales bacterium AB-hyl4]|uniref:Transposase n=1 Tax=Natronomicrosphaera hydrolytica TaxID=3242702 RepID=A0ABV4U8W3_9BACT